MQVTEGVALIEELKDKAQAFRNLHRASPSFRTPGTQVLHTSWPAMAFANPSVHVTNCSLGLAGQTFSGLRFLTVMSPK